MLCVTRCSIAQIQPKASPVVNREIPNARPVVMDMRMAMRQAQSELSYVNDNNLLITGNVSGGKHFRASVPYSASSALQTSMPSDSLSSFFRLTETQDFRASSPSAYTPYYSPSATAAHTESGQTGIITPVTFSQTPTPMPFTNQLGQPGMGLNSVDPLGTEETLYAPQRRYSDDRVTAKTPSDPWLTPLTPELEKLLQRPMKSMAFDVVLPQDANVTWPESTDPLAEVSDVNGLGLTRAEAERSRVARDPNASDPLMTVGYSMSSKVAMQAYAQTKFNTFMKAGDTYLKQGQYDKAENAYTLAGVYRSGDALAMAGKSHALLAKRAYSASALYLIRALEALPDYARTDIGLCDQVGGFKPLKGHIDRLEAYTEGKHVSELKLLLAFIYVQVGDFGLAQKALEDVLPDSSYEGARVALMEAARMPSNAVIR
jgi:hypothetical protein